MIANQRAFWIINNFSKKIFSLFFILKFLFCFKFFFFEFLNLKKQNGRKINYSIYNKRLKHYFIFLLFLQFLLLYFLNYLWILVKKKIFQVYFEIFSFLIMVSNSFFVWIQNAYSLTLFLALLWMLIIKRFELLCKTFFFYFYIIF